LTRGALLTELARGIPGLLMTGRGATTGAGRKLAVADPFCRTIVDRCDISLILPRGIPNPAELFSMTMRCAGTRGLEIGLGAITIVPCPGVPVGGIGLWKLIGALIKVGNPNPFAHPPGCQAHPKDWPKSHEPQ